MAMPSIVYGDPARVIEREQRYELMRTRGCAACARRGEFIGWGRYGCRIDSKPGFGGWCGHWREREDDTCGR
jgi:hypothetical protein